MWEGIGAKDLCTGLQFRVYLGLYTKGLGFGGIVRRALGRGTAGKVGKVYSLGLHTGIYKHRLRYL